MPKNIIDGLLNYDDRTTDLSFESKTGYLSCNRCVFKTVELKPDKSKQGHVLACPCYEFPFGLSSQIEALIIFRSA